MSSLVSRSSVVPALYPANETQKHLGLISLVLMVSAPLCCFHFLGYATKFCTSSHLMAVGQDHSKTNWVLV